jgi:O-acetyl-ADP-ribose deacetylase (regulator of RNase III)
MKIVYVKGDFIAGPEQIILHGCNAQGRMGRGAAKAVKKQMPWAYEAYKREYDALGLPLGHVVWAYEDGLGRDVFAKDWKGRVVGNLITQEQWKSELAPFPDGRNVDYDAVRKCFQTVDQYVVNCHYGTVHEMPRIGMVKIGSKLAGGDWSIVEQIIEEESKHFIPVVYYLED